MKHWQFWTIIAFFWLFIGLLAPFPLDFLFIAGAFAIGIYVHFIQKKEIERDRQEHNRQILVAKTLLDDLKEIKQLLGKKRLKNQKEVKHGNKHKRV